ncbi:AAA family ATPase [Tsukamurella sp. 8F]|uniref:ParA family protein n=1 Tax=unclassified Tsukamurella TaxID=2633480 RepID=UPI0023B9A08F|nr:MULTISPECIES: AAA family ATPase [unclassified Tsukamurella]MDF0532264.1 AAA family ATPase [Tsukamurella sp. 8J]MDF0589290.1 AAA family ATPase [Tsukamurella sp. 8F]
MNQPKKLAVANEKGGVGKTATTTGLASAIAELGLDVLVVDMDPQGNATSGLGLDVTDDMLTTYDLMRATVRGRAAEAIQATPWEHVDVIPASKNLSDTQADGANDLIFRLDIAFEGVDLSAYALVLIDCPPTLGKLLYAPLCAADGVIVVAEPTIDGVRGVSDIEETIANVKRRANPRLELTTIVISRARHNGEHDFRAGELRAAYGDTVARTVIPDYATRQDAHSAHTPIHQMRGGKSIALQVAYSDLLAEITETTSEGASA